MSSISRSFLQDVWIRKTLGIAGYSCLVYDHILTLENEVEFIWRGPWTVTKVTFLINRYGNLFGQTYMQVLDTGWVAYGPNSLEICEAFNLFSALFMFFCSESIHVIVLMRACAIWGCRRRVTAALIISYIFYLLFTVIMTGFGTTSATFGEFQYLGVIRICVGTIPQFIWFLPVASFILNTAVFVTTMQSLWQHSRESSHLYPSPLFRLLFRDAGVFYIMSTFFDGVTVLCWTLYASSPKYTLSLTVALNLLCIAGQRLVLNLRGLTARSYGPRTLSREVDRQIGRINDVSPEWWNSGGGFESGDEMADESGRLAKEVSVLMRGQDVEMATLDREGNGDASQIEAGLTTDMDGLWMSRTTRVIAGGLEVANVVEDMRPPLATEVRSP